MNIFVLKSHQTKMLKVGPFIPYNDTLYSQRLEFGNKNKQLYPLIVIDLGENIETNFDSIFDTNYCSEYYVDRLYKYTKHFTQI